MPTSSSPNWASMIMGAGPEQHGVTSNDWQPDKFEIAPVVRGPRGIFPTIYGVLREQRPDAVSAIFHDWKDYARLTERDMVDVIEHPINDGTTDLGARQTMAAAVKFFAARKPALLFIHLDHVDHAGHQIGWFTPEYFAAVRVADQLIGDMIAAIKAAGAEDDTAVLVTSDHGGAGTKHGGATMGEIEIPWVLAGPPVKAGFEITAPVNTYDTAPTLARLLGVVPPACWIARPVLPAFRVE
jgi:predicted AlkP superfamily pyrophosphatase or phosphodiesterase